MLLLSCAVIGSAKPEVTPQMFCDAALFSFQYFDPAGKHRPWVFAGDSNKALDLRLGKYHATRVDEHWIATDSRPKRFAFFQVEHEVPTLKGKRMEFRSYVAVDYNKERIVEGYGHMVFVRRHAHWKLDRKASHIDVGE